jgi:UDP:flavonoid glycosyltransferase YjiC (YdhE family)
MNITILALGSRGDIQPYVALGSGFQQAGYSVRLAAPENFRSLAVRYGLDFHSIGPSSQEVMAGETGRRMMTTGENAPAFMYELSRLLSEHAQEGLAQSLKACQHTDAILCNSFALMGFHIAEAMNIPCAGAWIYPLNRTAQYAPMGSPAWFHFPGRFNWLTYLIDEQIIQHAFRHIFREWRQTLGLPPLPITGFYEHLYKRRIPQIYGYSPTVVPRPTDWPERFVVSGYWFLNQAEGYEPSNALLEFLKAGPPPVYIGFGSVVGNDTAHLTKTILGAVKDSDQRFILAKGWGGLDLDSSNPQADSRIFVVDNIPHDWLFPKMAAIVHHGGAGTTAAAIRAGVPSVIVPFSGDQPFWGQRIQELGAGPAPILHTRLTAERLVRAIHAATNDKTMQERARWIGERIRAEDGVARAIDAFEKYVISV